MCSLCGLEHIETAASSSPELSLLPHDSSLIMRRFRRILVDIMWRNKYENLYLLLFNESNQKIQDLKSFKISKITPSRSTQFSLHSFFELLLENGKKVCVRLCEGCVLFSMFYNNQDLYRDAGRELCIALDVALGASGCEAIVEGFYSLMKAHKKSGRISRTKFWWSER